MIRHLHQTYHRHRKLIHRRLIVKAGILIIIAGYQRGPLKTRADSLYTGLGLSIQHSFSAYSTIDSTTAILSGSIRYTSGNTITITHLGSQSGISLSISGDTIATGVVSMVGYPTTGYTTIIFSPGSGTKTLSISYIKDGRETIQGPQWTIYSSYLYMPPTSFITQGFGGGGVRRTSFGGGYRGYNYRSNCIKDRLEKNITYSVCTQASISEFYKTFIRPTRNKSIHQRIKALNIFYQRISYQDSIVQHHTRIRTIIQQLTKRRSGKKTERLMKKLLLFVDKRSTTQLEQLLINKDQLTRELQYILKKRTLNIGQKTK